MRDQQFWLTSHGQKKCWGPFDSVPLAWGYLLGHSCETPEGIKEVNRHHEAGWTVNDHEVYPATTR